MIGIPDLSHGCLPQLSPILIHILLLLSLSRWGLGTRIKAVCDICRLQTGRLYIVLPIRIYTIYTYIPIPLPIYLYLYLYEALVWLTEVLVWLTQARVYKSAVCICRTPESKGPSFFVPRLCWLRDEKRTIGTRRFSPFPTASFPGSSPGAGK